MSSKENQYARQAADWTEHAYADVAAYLAHRAALIATLGPRLEPGDEVLDLACGDGGLGEALLARGLRYRGVDLTQEMVEAARTRLAGRAEVERRRSQRLRAAEPSRGDDRLPGHLLRA